MRFFKELHRRNVVRVAIAYSVTSWLLIQVSDVVLESIGAPQWAMQALLYLLLVGAVPVLAFSWIYELTPDGFKRDSETSSVDTSPTTSRRIDWFIIVILVGIVGYQQWGTSGHEDSTADQVRPARQDKAGPRDRSAGVAPEKTVAVLPFVNLSSDPEQEYFSDGLSEELLNLLARVPGLRVTSRTSAFSFKDRGSITIPEIGQILGTEHVLEGSVRRAGDQIRVSAQLVETSTDTQVWSGVWDRDLESVFAIQEEIARAVADALSIELLGELPAAPETTPEAFALYLRAGELRRDQVAASYYQAEALNERVLELDPTFAPAWTQRALIFYHGSAFQAWDSYEVTPRVRDAALQALRLDPESATARAILVYVAIDYDYDYAQAERELRAAYQLGAENIEVLRAAAEYHYRRGELEKTVHFANRAHSLDPLGEQLHAAAAYFYSGQQEEGLRLFRERVEAHPGSGYVNRTLAVALALTGDFKSALQTIEEEPADGHRFTALALIHEMLGNREQSTQWLEKAIQAGRKWTWEITEVHAFRDELDEAFKWINRAIERRDRGLRHVMISPFIDNMREDERFFEVLRRLGLAQAANLTISDD